MSDWYMNGSLFLEKLVFVWVYFQIQLRHILTKTKLECPFGLQISFGLVEETYMVSMLFFTTNPSKFVKFTIVPCPRCWCGQVWKKKSWPQNSLSLSERESCGKWRCGISKMTAISLFEIWRAQKERGASIWVIFCLLNSLPKLKHALSFCARHTSKRLMRVWHGLRYKTCHNFSENSVK